MKKLIITFGIISLVSPSIGANVTSAKQTIIQRLASNWNKYQEVMSKESRLIREELKRNPLNRIKEGILTPEFNKYIQELDSFFSAQKLNPFHKWAPLMNMSDNTLVQIFSPTPTAFLTALDGPLLLQLAPQAAQYNLRPLTPLETVVALKKGLFDTVTLQTFINIIPADAKIGDNNAREFATNVVISIAKSPFDLVVGVLTWCAENPLVCFILFEILKAS